VCSLGTLSPGQSATITITATALAEGQVINTAAVVALLDLNLANNVTTTAIDIVPVGGGGGGGPGGTADVALAMSASPDPGVVGLELVYTITATNHGPDPADTVTLVDTPPTGATFVSATSGQGTCTGSTIVTCDLGTIQNGSSATVTVRVVPVGTGVVSNAG
jgi:uncharacterized repeat protein (TIGR01451 family)